MANQTGSMDYLVRADTVIILGCENIHGQPPEIGRHPSRLPTPGPHRGDMFGRVRARTRRALHHRRATTHWMHIDDFAALFPTVALYPSVLYVEDAGVFTSAGTAAAIDLCLELVRQDFGAAAANEVARRMVIPPHRHGGQAQYLRWPMPPKPDRDLAKPWAGTRPISTPTSASKTSPDVPIEAGEPSSDAFTTLSA